MERVETRSQKGHVDSRRNEGHLTTCWVGDSINKAEQWWQMAVEDIMTLEARCRLQPKWMSKYYSLS